MAQREMNLALAAHVDAGKTTLSEAMLFLSGVLRRAGRVDHQDTFLDTDPLEKQRGITLFSKQARLTWNQRAFTLLDTPGHVDFAGDTGRTLAAADLCVLVISGPEGVQSHTRALWELCGRLELPVVLFVNKMDACELTPSGILDQLKRELGDPVVDAAADNAAEQWALCDDGALDEFLRTGTLTFSRLSRLTLSRSAFPCFFGSALKLEGVKPLMDFLSALLLPVPETDAFSARVFQITRDPQGARLCMMKVLSGSLHARDSLTLAVREGEEAPPAEKVTELRLYSGTRYESVREVEAGTICAAVGIRFPRVGDVLGQGIPGKPVAFGDAVFTRRVVPVKGELHALVQALKTLEEEEPLFRVRTDGKKQAVYVSVTGPIQLEVLSSRLRDRFGLETEYREPGVVYKETVLTAAEGVGHFEPLRHYAEVHLLLSPGEAGSGLRIESGLSVDDLARPWQQQILGALRGIPLRGVLTGAELTDMRITLIAGKAHVKHTEGGDFRQAALRALRQGLMKASCGLLEPWMKLEISLPREDLGKVLFELNRREARTGAPEGAEEMTLTASLPARLAEAFPLLLRDWTGGKASARMRFDGYAPCMNAEEVIASSGYDPQQDPEYPPDSVFCSHGAGVNVPWDQVDVMAHLPLRRDRAEDPVPAAPRGARASAYRGTREEDEELLAIFERTYGPVRARQLLPVKREWEQKRLEIRLPKEEILLVDGYNMIFAREELKNRAAVSLEEARIALLDGLCEYCAMTGKKGIVVFDAYRVQGGAGSAEPYGNLYVIYTRERETADAFIERTTYRTGGDVRVTVATSDGPEQAIALGNKALRMSSRELWREMDQVRRQLRSVLEQRSPDPQPRMEQAYKAAWKEKMQGGTEETDTIKRM